MKIRRSIQAATAAVVLGTAGALVLPAAASAQSATHTLKLIAVTKNSVVFTKSTGGEQGTDVNSAGKIVGFDMLYFKQTSATAGALGLTVDASGGFLYGTATANLSTGAVSNGKVTGGTDRFTGATGTFTAKNLNKSGTRTLLTITYSG
jgi:Na+/H+-dicarboxylate symporter